jgi:hypothetical protein
MDAKKLSEPLQVHQIEFRVQSINKGGYATILAYKNARADMQRLDEVCTPLGWKREHVLNNHNCIVSIWCDDKKQWVSKEDTGTESNAEAQKGLASDSFKRACFNWGIGRELYDYPVIQIKLKGGGNKNGSDVEWFLDEKNKDRWGNPSAKAGWGLKLKEWIWFSQWEGGVLIYLAAKDASGLRYTHGTFKKEEAK